MGRALPGSREVTKAADVVGDSPGDRGQLHRPLWKGGRLAVIVDAEGRPRPRLGSEATNLTACHDEPPIEGGDGEPPMTYDSPETRVATSLLEGVTSTPQSWAEGVVAGDHRIAADSHPSGGNRHSA
jgi:hypothetical protein